MPYDIITIGAAVQDIVVFSDAFTVRQAQQACFILGGKIPIPAPAIGSGGGATNAAVSFAHLGLTTACIARIGTDLGGQLIYQELKKSGVDTSLLQKSTDEATGVSIILTAPKGSRTALVHRGASLSITEKSIPWSRIKSEWIYLTNTEGNVPLVKTIFSHATKRGIKVAWNPGAHECLAGTKNSLRRFLKYADVLLFNREEAAALVQMPLHTSIKNLFTHLVSLAPHAMILLTDGPRGAWVRHGKLVLEVGNLPIEAKSTVGSGDAFGSAFVAGLMHYEEDWVDAARLAALNANSVVQHVGTKAGLLRRLPTAKQRAMIPVEFHEWL